MNQWPALPVSSADQKTSLLWKLNFKSEEIIELILRGSELADQVFRLMLDPAIVAKHVGIFLHLSPEQYSQQTR